MVQFGAPSPLVVVPLVVVPLVVVVEVEVPCERLLLDCLTPSRLPSCVSFARTTPVFKVDYFLKWKAKQ